MRPIANVLYCASLWAGLGLAAPALATDAGELDLSLPASSYYRNDPPGTWYGDTSGVPPTTAATGADAVSRSRCPPSPDGEPAKLTGSVSAGAGYSSGAGNSTFGAARLNYCNEYTTGSGRSGVVNMQVDMGRYDGPGYYHGVAPRGPAPGPGPMMMRGGARP